MGEKDTQQQPIPFTFCLSVFDLSVSCQVFVLAFVFQFLLLAGGFLCVVFEAIGLNQREHASGVDERPLQRYHRSLFWGTAVLSVSCCSVLVCFFVCCR